MDRDFDKKKLFEEYFLHYLLKHESFQNHKYSLTRIRISIEPDRVLLIPKGAAKKEKMKLKLLAKHNLCDSDVMFDIELTT